MSDATASNGFRTQVTAMLSVRDWEQAIDFYKAAFGARECTESRAVVSRSWRYPMPSSGLRKNPCN